ncbi:MAG: hypothetical protein JOZ31_02505 [Verrucomicrobia bacterium]|nr:hypothetical protein [Verrucomicrobiota bacterium]
MGQGIAVNLRKARAIVRSAQRWTEQPRIGLATGLGTETALASFFYRFLYKVTPADLTTLLLTAGVLGAAAFLGCLAPALRAANLDPIEAIRER